MNLPTVTENSEISRRAERLFSVKMPGEWTISTPKEGDDYGIDVTLTIVDEGKATGRCAHVQLKGTRASVSESLRFRMKETTLNFLRSHTDIAVIVRVHVDEERYWLIHIFDGRTRAAPADDGYVNIQLNERDEVSPTALALQINRLSYRNGLEMSDKRFGIAVRPGNEALRLQSWLNQRLPLGLAFEREDSTSPPTQQLLLELPATWIDMTESAQRSTDINAVLSDLATNRKRDVRCGDPGLLIIDLVMHMVNSGVGRIAAQLFIYSPDLYTQFGMTQYGVAYDHVLREACCRYLLRDEIADFVQRAIKSRAHWAGEWAVNFILKGSYSPDADIIAKIFDCFQAKSFHLNTLRIRIHLLCRQEHEARSLLEQSALPNEGPPEALFEFGQLAHALGSLHKARLAWKRAAKNGYDRFACQLEVARSFLSAGDFYEAIRSTPKRGVPKDKRCFALMTLLSFLRSLFQLALTNNPRAFDYILAHDSNIVSVLESIAKGWTPLPPDARALLTSAFAIVLALRNDERSSAKMWGSALEWAIRANLPPAEIDAIVNLSAPSHGGEPLRLAALALGDHRGRSVLERWHLIMDQQRGVQVERRTEDFITRKPLAPRSRRAAK
jgi:hypothetical protein